MGASDDELCEPLMTPLEEVGAVSTRSLGDDAEPLAMAAEQPSPPPASVSKEEKKEETSMARPVKIIRIDTSASGKLMEGGDEGGFSVDEAALDSVLSGVPDGMKVCIVSVVGAFRTGKSFLLDFFLRYLRSGKASDDDWMVASGSSLEGNHNKGQTGKSQQQKGFGWRSGRERMTTGIWMWGEHFVRTLPSTGEKVAILIVDTQGMFDSTLSQMLTASIFGLSTLISSFFEAF